MMTIALPLVATRASNSASIESQPFCVWQEQYVFYFSFYFYRHHGRQEDQFVVPHVCLSYVWLKIFVILLQD